MTAQDSDLVEFTDADYNSLRSSIYSPNVASAVEVSSFQTIRFVISMISQ